MSKQLADLISSHETTEIPRHIPVGSKVQGASVLSAIHLEECGRNHGIGCWTMLLEHLAKSWSVLDELHVLIVALARHVVKISGGLQGNGLVADKDQALLARRSEASGGCLGLELCQNKALIRLGKFEADVDVGRSPGTISGSIEREKQRLIRHHDEGQFQAKEGYCLTSKQMCHF